jgi:hypothetical protein
MKNVIACLTTAFMLATLTSTPAHAEKKPHAISGTAKESAKLEALISRLK